VLKVDGALAGFALIEPSEVMDDALELADLFIMQRYRRRGIAEQVVRHFLQQRMQPWTIITFDDAPDACTF
jgi:predicted acetyltransferase